MSFQPADRNLFFRYLAAAALLVASCGLFLSIPYFFAPAPEPEKGELVSDARPLRTAKKSVVTFRTWRL